MKRSRAIISSILIVLAARSRLMGLCLVTSCPPGTASYTNVTDFQIQANWTDGGNPSGTSYQAIESIAPSPSTNGQPGNQASTTQQLFAVFSNLSPNTFYYVDV